MTCIIGLKHQGIVYMGADSAVGNWQVTHQNGPCKIFAKSGLLIGLTGSPRDQQIVRHSAAFPAPKRKLSADAADRYMYGVCNIIMESLIEHKHATITDSRPVIESRLLIAFGRHLYTINYHFEYMRLDEQYATVGWDEYALGSLYSTAGMEPIRRIKTALAAEARHHHFVKPPFHIMNTKDDT